MKKPNQLPEEIVTLLLPRLSDELYAAYMYRQMANWAKGCGYNIAADYFSKESENEFSHAKAIENFLVDWNVTFSLPVLQTPVYSCKTLVDAISNAYNIEHSLYEEYEETSVKIFKTGDMCSFDFLQQFRTAQTKSVAEYSDMLNILEGCDASNKFEMLMLEERIFKA